VVVVVIAAGTPPTGPYPSVVGTPAISGSGSVIMIYGLTPGKHNCDHVFNLLCSYGNVLKVTKAVGVRLCLTRNSQFWGETWWLG